MKKIIFVKIILKIKDINIERLKESIKENFRLGQYKSTKYLINNLH
jgi:hypothetical protein